MNCYCLWEKTPHLIRIVSERPFPIIIPLILIKRAWFLGFLFQRNKSLELFLFLLARFLYQWSSSQAEVWIGSSPSSLPIFVSHVCWAPCLGTAFVCRGTAEFHSGTAGVCLTASGNTMQELTVNAGKKSNSGEITFTTRKANWNLF